MKPKYISLILILFIAALYFVPSPQVEFKDNYKMNDEVSKSFESFISLPTKSIEFNDKQWTYFVGGEGEKTIFFAHGMGGSYYMWWQQYYALEKNYKVIAYDLPKGVSSLEEASEGILAILDAENIEKTSIVGTSMGGYITEYVVHKAPGRIDKAVFGNTFPPNRMIKENNEWKSKAATVLPGIIIYALRNQNYKKNLAASSSNSGLLKAYLLSVPFDKKSFRERYKIVTDFFETEEKQAEINAIPKLILECDNDPLVSKDLRIAIKSLYPNSEVYNFGNEGHVPNVSKSDEFNNVLIAFLENGK